MPSGALHRLHLCGAAAGLVLSTPEFPASRPLYSQALGNAYTKPVEDAYVAVWGIVRATMMGDNYD